MNLINNISALNISRNLDLTTISMFKTMNKLSSGLRINSASDGPAALVISERMRSQIASLNQEIENTSIAINKYQTTDSALQDLRGNLNEIRTLAVAASNTGVNDAAMQEAYQREADDLVQSYNRIVETSSFGNQKLLDGSSGAPANVPKLDKFDLSTAEAAGNSIAAIDDAVTRLDQNIADIGATQKNSLESHLSNLRIEAQNLTAAESQIRNTDYAAEFASLIRDQLLVSSAVSLLSHSALTPRLVLNLLSEE